MADPPVQERAEQVTEPQAEQVTEPETTVVADPPVQERAEQVTEPQAEQVTEPETTVVADPPVQERAEQVTEPETTVVADPPVQERAEQVTEPQAALESAAETGQKTPVPQAPANSDLQRREIKITRFGMFGMSVIVAILTFWGSRSVIRRIWVGTGTGARYQHWNRDNSQHTDTNRRISCPRNDQDSTRVAEISVPAYGRNRG